MSASPSLRRDRLACWLCNVVLTRVASRWYRAMIGGSIRYGLHAASGDHAKEIELLRRLEFQLREEAQPGNNGLDWDLIDLTLDDIDWLRRHP